MLAVLVALGSLGTVPYAQPATSIDELYAKAKAEGALSFYAGGPTKLWEAQVKLFKRRYPGIDVKIEGGFSNVLDSKIDAQIKAKKMEVDSVFFQTIQDFVRWKKEGALLASEPDGFDKISAHWKDKDGAYLGLWVNAHPYAYNTGLVKPAHVPKSALDFLKPEFRGKIVSAYPQDDDATLYDFNSITEKYGWGYWTKYMAQKPNFIQGHLGVARSISSGENLVSLDTIASISLPRRPAASRTTSPSPRSIPSRSGRLAALCSRARPILTRRDSSLPGIFRRRRSVISRQACGPFGQTSRHQVG